MKQRCARTSAAGRLKCLRAVEDDVDTVSLPKTWFIWIRSLGRIIASSSSIACHPASVDFEFLGSASTYACARRLLTSMAHPYCCLGTTRRGHKTLLPWLNKKSTVGKASDRM